MGAEARYVPAAGRRVFARLYDPALALTVRERHFRSLLQERLSAFLPLDGTVVDVGCGTGTFAISLASARSDVEVIGIDGDVDVLSRAKSKPGADRVSWREGLAGELDLSDESADAIAMSLLLHHLDRSAKNAALAEALRILRPGGRLHIADWGRPHDIVMRGAFLILQTLDGFENTRDHAAGRLPLLVREAGLIGVISYAKLRTVWGSLELVEAIKSS
ncbi:class I SAM-dependent methyltransferase [Thermoleophilia bacterium SCSIO 60948]|nr:class I SAM-dependent methyltransferase [Thermoleophilia bacterium SCSIO 60948]